LTNRPDVWVRQNAEHRLRRTTELGQSAGFSRSGALGDVDGFFTDE
jgi:hypothetical protein